MERLGRRAHYLRLAATVLLILAAAGLFVSWQSLRSKHLAAEKSLTQIWLALDFQKTMIFRQVPLDPDNRPQDAATRRKFDDAFGELRADNLATRVQAIQVVQGILSPRIPRANARMNAEFPVLAAKYARDLTDSMRDIKNSKTSYNSAVSDYNREGKSFPWNIAHHLFGFPERLVPLK